MRVRQISANAVHSWTRTTLHHSVSISRSRPWHPSQTTHYAKYFNLYLYKLLILNDQTELVVDSYSDPANSGSIAKGPQCVVATNFSERS